MTGARVARLAEATLTDLEARREFDRLLADPRLELPPRALATLTYLTDAKFAGAVRADTYAIAKDLYGRSANFDPVVDPIVRIEIARLRRALERYYDAHGSTLNAEIIIPHGTYIPRFVATGTDPEHLDSDDSPNGSASDPGNTERAANVRFWPPPKISAGQHMEQSLFYLSIAGALIVTIGGFALAVSILIKL